MLVEGLGRLLSDAELYRDQLTREEPVRVGLRLTDTEEEATLGFGESVTLEPGLKAPAVTLTMESCVFRGIMDGSRDFGAMIGRSKMSDIRPINYQLNEPGRLGDAMETVKALMTVFFTPGRVKVRPLRRELAGDAHGAHPIPLVYWRGVRSAWYNVNPGGDPQRGGGEGPIPPVHHSPGRKRRPNPGTGGADNGARQRLLCASRERPQGEYDGRPYTPLASLGHTPLTIVFND